ncbi:MAG: RNA methyltransferase [Fuerstiella sp.]|nr:RNA methyltransferase [Fuerstiella sp.]
MYRLKNPHSILAALQQRPAAVKSIQIRSGRHGTTWKHVAKQAAEHGISVTSHNTASRQRRSSQHTQRTGGNSALVEPPSPVPLSGLLPRSEQPVKLWLALDTVQDPQNLGALFRLAGFFGVCGIVMTRDKSASVTETVCDVSAGGVEHVPYTQVSNLAQAIKTVQDAGIWVLGTCERSTTSIRNLRRDRHWMLILGNEADGLRRLTREKCDQLCSLPGDGPVSSLNVATAAAACLTSLSAPPSSNC